jgi:hypothetical protein
MKDGRRALLREPFSALPVGPGALCSDREKLAVDIHVHRARVDSRQIGSQDVAIAFLEQIDGHGAGHRCVEHALCEAVELAERVKGHCHYGLPSRQLATYPKT